MLRVSFIAAFLTSLTLAGPAGATEQAWPPRPGDGNVFVHFGEEHWDDPDGGLIFPRVIEASARYTPDAVMTSGDKSTDGTVENLTRWREYMAALDRAGVPYYAAVGNHDRKHKPGFPEGVDPTGDSANYLEVFKERPYPFGDGAPVSRPGFAPTTRPDGDPAGASTHYTVDIGTTRWIFLDNSCFTFVICDTLQNPSFPDGGAQGQLDYMRARATEAGDARRVFVVMHMPTQDPRPGHSEPTPFPHNMGEGTAPDNAQFEQAATAAGVDGVFAGHIKGQWIYSAGGVPYYTDGGAGGAVYVSDSEQTGVDYGYWHGFRIVHVAPGGQITTDAVPIFREGTLAAAGPDTALPGEAVRFTAAGDQPTEKGPPVKLELRAPAADRPNRVNLPAPAHIWTTSNPLVAFPLPAKDDDPRRNPLTQTVSGSFTAACPGKTSIKVTSGHAVAARTLTVRSRAGKIVRSVRRGARSLRRGRSASLATVSLAQPAELLVRVRRGRTTIRQLLHRCAPAGRVAVRWNGRGVRRAARRGRYTLEIRVRSDRRDAVTRLPVRVR